MDSHHGLRHRRPLPGMGERKVNVAHPSGPARLATNPRPEAAFKPARPLNRTAVGLTRGSGYRPVPCLTMDARVKPAHDNERLAVALDLSTVLAKPNHWVKPGMTQLHGPIDRELMRSESGSDPKLEVAGAGLGLVIGEV